MNNDASLVCFCDMDSRRTPSSYQAEFDACDPLGSLLEWSRREPARVLRRRCRSEGIDRSPYEDVNRESLRMVDSNSRYYRLLPNKSHFTLNSYPGVQLGRYPYECSFDSAENGDYLMAHEQNDYNGYQPSRTKFHRLSPTRPYLLSAVSSAKAGDTHLAKVEELLEKVDHDMVEVTMAKQPLKSILNNPLPKSPPQGILKKPKNKLYQDSKINIEGRRRQRAASESDNLFCTFHLHSSTAGYETRIQYQANSMKRAKDNSGTGYSYGSALASLSPSQKSPARSPSNITKNTRCICKDEVIILKKDDKHVLRTTAINNEVNGEMIRQEPPAPACPVVSPALPVSSVTALLTPKKTVKTSKKKAKSKTKSGKMTNNTDGNGEVDIDNGHNKSADNWQMETDLLIAEMEKLEKFQQVPVRKKQDEQKENGIPIQAVTLNGSFHGQILSKESSSILPESISSCLRVSLFPRVPPYLKFISPEEAASKLPLAIQKHLKWKVTTITPIIVKKTLINSGFRLVKSDCDTAECPQEETIDWIGIWGKHMKSLMFRAIKDGQKMNHFPGTFQIGRKDRLWRNLQKLANKYGLKEFGIMPKTYVLPHDLKLLKNDWDKYAVNNEKWIIKPPASARGTGIKVVSRWAQIPKKRPVVVQRYVSKPYLINGNKFDMRLYVLLASIHPLRIYIYKDGLARFASVKYNDELSSLNDRYMHLTNYSINRLSKNYTPNEDFASCEGHKWTLHALFQYLKTEKNVDTDALWESMKDLVIKTIISGEGSISSLTKANITSRYNCYELFGIDVLLDEDLKPWLLEVNISPSLHSASPLDIHVKGPLVTTVLNIAQFQVPLKANLEVLSKDKSHKLANLPYDSRLYTIYLSKEERDKHIIYTNIEERDLYLRDILSTLTPDDVRHLIQAEDELTQVGGDMERIFPTHDTHKYLTYLTGPRYYNRLFDAWESRYSLNRAPGIELLRNLCDIGYHLEVPPVPLKRATPQLSALERCRMTWTRRRRPPRSAPPCPRWRPSSSVAPPRRPRAPVAMRYRPLWRPRSNRAPSITPKRDAAGVDLNRNVHCETTSTPAPALPLEAFGL